MVASATPSVDIGDLIELKATFKSSAGVNTDPTTVTFKIKDGNGKTTVYTKADTQFLLNPSVGIWIVNYKVIVGGMHYARFEGTGTVTAAIESKFPVNYSAFN